MQIQNYLPNFLVSTGSKIQLSAWEHASDPVKQLAEQLQGFPDWRLASVETALRQTLSLADVLVWEHFFGLTRAAEIVAVVDPWVLPGEKERAKIGVKGFVQQAVDKAKHANKSLIFTPLKACQPTCCLQS